MKKNILFPFDDQRLGTVILVLGLLVLVVGLTIDKLSNSFWTWFPLITLTIGLSLQVLGRKSLDRYLKQLQKYINDNLRGINNNDPIDPVPGLPQTKIIHEDTCRAINKLGEANSIVSIVSKDLAIQADSILDLTQDIISQMQIQSQKSQKVKAMAVN